MKVKVIMELTYSDGVKNPLNIYNLESIIENNSEVEDVNIKTWNIIDEKEPI